MTQILTGQVLCFNGDPFAIGPQAAQIEREGAVLIEDGLIKDHGPASRLRAENPQVPVTSHGNHLISAGFIDAHVHYPQTAIIASWGKRLIDWLNTYTFPEEMRFADRAYADQIAGRYFDFALAHGTTTACSFGTIHPESVDAFFAQAQARGMRMLTGKTCMDRNAPEGLRDSAKAAYDQSAELIGRWHGKDRLSYVITPRFAPTSTPEQLEALGALWRENPDCLMQTHLNEQTDEIEWVRSLFPKARDYLDIYDHFGLVGKGALFGHSIWMEAREIDRLREVDASLIHCPTSNMFIGSGLFDARGLKGAGLRVGLATDTGGGTSFSMLATMASAYKVAQLRRETLHPSELWWLATQGSAKALGLEDKIGNIAKGMEADLVVIDLASTPLIGQAAARAEDAWAQIFPSIIMGDDRAVAATYVGGRKV